MVTTFSCAFFKNGREHPGRTGLQCSRSLDELQHVEPSLAAFVLRDGGLRRHTERIGHWLLGEARAEALHLQERDERRVTVWVE